MEQPWVLKWQSLLPISLWERQNHKFQNEALAWKRYIDDTFSIWNINKDVVTQFIEQANSHHPTIKFTAEVSDTETMFLDTKVYKGKRFPKEYKLNVKTHFKATETFQYTHFSSCHPPGVKMGFIKGEALRLLRTNSSQAAFKTAIKKNLKQISKKEGTLKLLFQTLSQKLHLRRENTPYNINRKQTRQSCLLSHNIAHQ